MQDLSNNEGQSQYFDVYIRKLKFKDEIIEILIYDNTEIKQAEKTNIESKYKQQQAAIRCCWRPPIY